jgi:hypothetical protein|tara:strand:- start:673 stop:792 length:120 start_codon:yes stop_codon:yes gene_type:complete
MPGTKGMSIVHAASKIAAQRMMMWCRMVNSRVLIIGQAG